MQALSEIRARTVVIPTRDIDTDQIIAARFLTTTTKEGLGRSLFHDLRYDSEGRPRPEFPLNRPDSAGCRILVSGNNFGCGSSREHAPWALLDYGFQVIVSTEIADIFFNNALKNGLVPVVVDEATHRYLLEHPGVELTVDVRQSRLVLPDGRAVTFPMDRFARHCLVEGIDQLGYLLQHADAIRQFEHGRRWTP
jgi:3-isopropylmalate/(R)-2-methylmalate dehydratase small subunit